MIGLLLKDFCMLRTYLLRQFGAMAVAFGVICLATRSFTILPSAMVLAGLMLLVSCFSLDETAHWDAYALTLPVNPRDIVRAKYTLALLSTIGITVFSVAICSGLEVLVFQGSAREVLISAGAVCTIYIPVFCICLPLFIKLGVEKARVYLMLAMFVPFMAITFGLQLFGDRLKALAAPTPTQIALLIALAVLALAVCVAVSYRISVKLYEAKEF